MLKYNKINWHNYFYSKSCILQRDNYFFIYSQRHFISIISRTPLCCAIVTSTLFLTLLVFPAFCPWFVIKTPPDTKERLHSNPLMFLVDFGWKIAWILVSFGSFLLRAWWLDKHGVQLEIFFRLTVFVLNLLKTIKLGRFCQDQKLNCIAAVNQRPLLTRGWDMDFFV